MNIQYLPLEPYKARYTEQLSSKDGWAERAFAKKFSQVFTLRPSREAQTIIRSGKVLDRQSRPIWAMDQMTMLAESNALDLGKIYLDDFFHPGLSALPYLGKSFQAYSFCWAQSWDIYDFTFKMGPWMRAYELMAMQIFSKVFVACPELKELMMAWSPELADKVEVVGLPFNSDMVALQRDPTFQCDKFDVVYASRFDKEKRPGFFLDVVEYTGAKAAICTGHEKLKGDDYEAVKRAEYLADKGQLTIFSGVSKGEYYSVLSQSHVQFNCALQDWVSFTLLEALTYECVPLYPNFRAFPSVLGYSEPNLYNPDSVSDAGAKLTSLLGRSRNFALGDEILAYHDSTLSRIADIIHKD